MTIVRNPDEAMLYGLEQQIVSLDQEIARVSRHLQYLRSERGRISEKAAHYRKLVES